MLLTDVQGRKHREWMRVWNNNPELKRRQNDVWRLKDISIDTNRQSVHDVLYVHGDRERRRLLHFEYYTRIHSYQIHTLLEECVKTVCALVAWRVECIMKISGKQNIWSKDSVYTCSAFFNCFKGKGLDTCYSAAYMSQTRDQRRFTISEVAIDWHEPMVPQRIMWPSIARANGQLDPRCS